MVKPPASQLLSVIPVVIKTPLTINIRVRIVAVGITLNARPSNVTALFTETTEPSNGYTMDMVNAGFAWAVGGILGAIADGPQPSSKRLIVHNKINKDFVFIIFHFSYKRSL